MEKLWNLLNEYEDYKEKEYGYSNYGWRLHEISDEEEGIELRITAFRVDESELGVEESIAVIICKGYMFIKWLVENDKIDFRKLDPKINDSIPTRYYLGTYIRYSFEKEILMALSIQDNPISFLTSILK